MQRVVWDGLDLTYGLRNGVLVSIDDVPSGLACGCTCPGCGVPLVAKRGRIRAHHFAHAAGGLCEGAFESMAHLLAKTLIQPGDTLHLPAYDLDAYHAVLGDVGERLEWWWNEDRSAFALLRPSTSVVERVEVERQQGDVRPDLVCWVAGKPLYVEIVVSHPVDAAKRAKLRARGVPTLELVVRPHDVHEVDTFKKVLLETGQRRWAYSPKGERRFGALIDSLAPVEQFDRETVRCPLAGPVYGRTCRQCPMAAFAVRSSATDAYRVVCWARNAEHPWDAVSDTYMRLQASARDCGGVTYIEASVEVEQGKVSLAYALRLHSASPPLAMETGFDVPYLFRDDQARLRSAMT